MAKRAREQAVKERRDRKQAKKIEAAAARRAAGEQAAAETPPQTDPQPQMGGETAGQAGRVEEAHATGP
jgi:hypothetical protein